MTCTRILHKNKELHAVVSETFSIGRQSHPFAPARRFATSSLRGGRRVRHGAAGMLTVVAWLLWAVSSGHAAEEITLNILPGSPPQESVVAVELSAPLLGTTTDRSRLAGEAVLVLDRDHPPFGTAQLTQLDVVLSDGMDLSLAGGTVRAIAQPGATRVRMIDPGEGAPVVGDQFTQLDNLFQFEGQIELSTQQEPFDLAAVAPISADLTDIRLHRSADRLRTSLSVNLQFEAALSGMGFPIQIPLTIAISGKGFGSAAVPLWGDLDGDSLLSVADLDRLAELTRAGTPNEGADLDGNGTLDFADRVILVHDLLGTFFGDANLDGQFDSTDLIKAFQGGLYESPLDVLATWTTGDWDGNGRFESQDLIVAFRDGGFEAGPPLAMAVPEPTAWYLWLAASLPAALLAQNRRRRLPNRQSTLWTVYLLVAPSCLVALEGPSLAIAATNSVRPNIVFFLADDQRFDQLGCAGHPIVRTPHIDRLAQQGVRFRHAFVTTSICAASRVSILTGQYERTHGYTFGRPPLTVDAAKATYPSQLKQTGYRTGFIGKLGVAFERGSIDVMFDQFRPLNRNPYFKRQADGTLRHITDQCADYAIEFLQEPSAKQGQPFCLSVSFNAPHAEDSDKQNQFPPPPAVANLYRDVRMPRPLLDEAIIFENQPSFLRNSLNRERFFWRWDTPQKYDRNLRNYLRMLSGVDAAIGRILDELQRLGLDDNTVVIFAADNGYYLGSRGFAGKWSHYEESLRVPLIVADPRRPAAVQGRVVEGMALNLDIPATILTLARAKVPNTYQGQTLVPLFDEPADVSVREDFFCEHLMNHPKIPKWEGVRGNRWVYARYFEQQPVYEFLHDLDTDPHELVNLATDPRFASELATMRARCNSLRDRYASAPREIATTTASKQGPVLKRGD